MTRYGISCSTSITDENLDHLVQEIMTFFPQSDKKTVAERLLACGIRTTHQRVRDLLLCVHPLHCWKYQMASPNALWHLNRYQGGNWWWH